MHKLLAIGLLSCALASLFACGKKAPSDEDLLEQFVRDVTGKADEALVQRAIGYTALDSLPIDVRVPHYAGVYDASQRDELFREFRQRMERHFYQTVIDVRSQKIELHGADADIRLGLMTAVGPLHAEFGMHKLGAQWKVQRVYVDL